MISWKRKKTRKRRRKRRARKLRNSTSSISSWSSPTRLSEAVGAEVAGAAAAVAVAEEQGEAGVATAKAVVQVVAADSAGGEAEMESEVKSEEWAAEAEAAEEEEGKLSFKLTTRKNSLLSADQIDEKSMKIKSHTLEFSLVDSFSQTPSTHMYEFEQSNSGNWFTQSDGCNAISIPEMYIDIDFADRTVCWIIRAFPAAEK